MTNNVDTFLREIGLYPEGLPTRAILRPSNHLDTFEPIVVEGKDVSGILQGKGAVFAYRLESIEIPRPSGKPDIAFYAVLGFRGIALVVAALNPQTQGKFIVFAIDRVTGGLENQVGIGKSINSRSYVRAVRNCLEKLLHGEEVVFPRLPLRFNLNDVGLREHDAGRWDLLKIPGRVRAAVREYLPRERLRV